jgi:hypothetical protein
MEDLHIHAASSLAEIDVVEQRTKAALAYRSASAFFVLWGVLVSAGAVLDQTLPGWSTVIWTTVDAVGLAGSCALVLYRLRGSSLERSAWRFVGSYLVLGLYGLAWTYLFAPASHDQIAVFWSTLMMMGLVVAGLWRGPLFALCGLAGTALCFAAFFYAGEWLHLWIGFVYAVGVALGGVWLYRIGVGD